MLVLQPETAGKSLEEIDLLFADSSKVHSMQDAKTEYAHHEVAHNGTLPSPSVEEKRSELIESA